MRAGANAGIIVAAPVNEIVPALRALARVIGNLVGRKAGLVANLLRDIVEIAREVRRWVSPACRWYAAPSEEWCVGLNGELIERQMLGGFRDGAI